MTPETDSPQLVRGLGLVQATALNVANMVGIGPFITIPLFLKSMHGPQALVAFPAAALLVLCDGLIVSELGAALPASGGAYHFLREIFGRYRYGRLLPFLFIWQFLVFMERLLGRGAALGFTALVVWTALAGVFAMTLGYSRIPFAAARKGDFFSLFARLHATDRYPVVSLLAVGGITAVFCFLPLDAVIEATVTVRIVVQFIGQIAALHVLRTTRPDVSLPFRMWLYPLPSLIALLGWTFVLVSSKPWFLLGGLGVIASGCVAYLIWQRRMPRPPEL